MKQFNRTLAAGVAASASMLAHGAAYEKVVLWSAEYATVAGAASAIVDDSQALYFNPAGLAAAPGELSFNLSPTVSRFDGPFVGHDGEAEGETELRPVFGLTASMPVDERLGIGVGVYAAGGTNAVFEDLDLGSVDGYRPDAKSDLSVVEFSAGAGYQLTERLRIGAAWRVVVVNAELNSPRALAMTPFGPVFGEVAITDLEDEDYGGYRLGAQYTADGWGLGLDYRSGVDFEADGDAKVKGGAGTLFEGDASIESTFPEQVSVGGFVDFNRQWRGVAEFTWTHYGKLNELPISSSIPVVDNTAIPQQWGNQENYKLGLIWSPPGDWVWRGGYAYTSQVTPDAFARATFASPGPGHTLTVGTGTTVGNSWELGFGLEYSFAEGDVDPGQGAAPLSDVGYPGDYESHAWVAHFGLSWRY